MSSAEPASISPCLSAGYGVPGGIFVSEKPKISFVGA